MAPPPPPPPPFPFSKKPRRRLSWSSANYPPVPYPRAPSAERGSPTPTLEDSLEESDVGDDDDCLRFHTDDEKWDVAQISPGFSSDKKESRSLTRSNTMTGTKKSKAGGGSKWGYGRSIGKKQKDKEMTNAQADSPGFSRTESPTSKLRRDDRDEYDRLVFHTDSEKYNATQTRPESSLKKVGKRSVEQSNTSAATKEPNASKGSKWGYGWVVGKKQKEQEAQANFLDFPETDLPLYKPPEIIPAHNRPIRRDSQQMYSSVEELPLRSRKNTLPSRRTQRSDLTHKTPETIPAPNRSTRNDSQSTTTSRIQASQAELERNEREAREDARRREEEWRRREREARRKEQDAQRREEDSRRKEERLKRKEEETIRKEEELRLKLKEAEYQAEELKLKQQEARRQDQEVRRREEKLRRREEELRRRENEIAARQQADLRKREEVDSREGETYHPEEQAQEEKNTRKAEDPNVKGKETSSREPEDIDRSTTKLQAQLLIEAKAEEERRVAGVLHPDAERGKASEIWAQKQIEQAKGKQRSPSGHQSRIPYSTHAWDTCRPSIFSVRTSMSSYQSSFDQGDGGMTDWQRRQEEVYRKQQEQFCKERERLESVESS